MTLVVGSVRRRTVTTTAALLGASLVAWIVTVERMRGMDAGPGTDLGGLGWFLGIWVTMMAAMMLPSAAPMVLSSPYSSDSRGAAGRSSDLGLRRRLPRRLDGSTGSLPTGSTGSCRARARLRSPGTRGGPYVAGGAIVAAGLYQLTPLKEVCLRHCRGPLHFVLHGWREGGSARCGWAPSTAPSASAAAGG